MQRAWLVIKNKQAGLSVLEVLLAATVFGFLTVALSGAIIYGRSGTAMAGDRQQAIALADEGVEAVHNIRDAAYSNFPADGTYGLVQSGSPLVWNFSGSSDTNGIFSRQVAISTIDSTHKLITSTVTWTTGGVSHQVASTARLSNWRAALPVTGGPIMIAYSKTTNTPFYRTWNGIIWGTEGSAGTVGGNIDYVVLKSSRTRNETILGTQDSTGAIYVQIWNGTTWTNKTQVGTGSTTTKSFDIAYEKSGDRAVIAYTATASAVDFDYRIWNGTTLSSATTVTAPPTTGAINWIEMEQNPISTSNEIALIMLDATTAVYGMTWNGTTWGTMGVATTWDTTAATASKDCIDVAYEQTSGRAMFMWGDSVSTNQYYRIWNGTTLSATNQQLIITDEGGVAEWVRLAARPSSNEIMFGVQDAAADLNTRKWSGSAWDTSTQHVEHDATVENIASMNFDIVWETYVANAGKAWLVWGDGATTSVQQWSGSAWGSITALSGSDDNSFVRLRADPSTTAAPVFAVMYNNSTAAAAAREISSRELTNGVSAWPAKTTLWSGPTSADPVFFRVDIAIP